MPSARDLPHRIILILVFACFNATEAASNSDYIVSTIAGGVAPATQVAARNAWIGSISGMTMDSAGNIYLSTSLNCVFRIDTAGVLTRVAGTCRPGYSGDGGPALNAQLYGPAGLAVDGRGTLYIADSANQAVRKVFPDGTITTIAGNGQLTTSGDGGPASRAALTNPRAVAVDAIGNVYIAENNAIRRVSPDGIITNLAGNWRPGLASDGRTAIKAQGVTPNSLAVDAAGNLYFADSTNHKVGRISPSGIVSTLVGTGKAGYSGDRGPAASAQLGYLGGIALDRGGNLYIADSGNARIRRVSVDGTITTIAGNGIPGTSGDEGLAVSAALTPSSLAVDDHGTVYVVGGPPAAWLRRISADGRISTMASKDFSAEDPTPAIRSGLHYPSDLTIDAAGGILIAEYEMRRIRRIDTRGRLTTVAGCPACMALGDSGPATRAYIGADPHLAADAKGNLYISESGRIRKVSRKGIITTIAGTGLAGFAGDGGPADKAQLRAPEGIAVDSSGNIYIADSGNGRVRKVAVNGTITTVAGNGGKGHFADGRAAVDVPLNAPGRLAVDSRGNLYILEAAWSPYSQVRKVSPAGITSTVGGLQFPQAIRAIAVDANDALYLVSGSTVDRPREEGGVERIGGTGEPGYSGDGGPALSARFANLNGIAIGGKGRIYVSEASGAVRMLTPVPAPKQDTSDLQVELRSATGSNTFQIGEQIPLEVFLSSSTPNRYLQPCSTFVESHFGYPQCRFFNRWNFSIVSGGGWVDLTQEFPPGPVTTYSNVSGNGSARLAQASGTGRYSGPTLEVPNPDLSKTPVKFSYILTRGFRFDAPGEYRVRIAMDIGLDDESTRRRSVPDPTIRPHKVSVIREMVLQIVPTKPEWQAEVIRKGVEATEWFARPAARQSSPELQRRNQEAADAFCNLGTADAARTLARLLLSNAPYHPQGESCLERTASPSAAIEEMERLLADPDAAIHPEFFRMLIKLLSRDESRGNWMPLPQTPVDNEREKLYAALSQKHGEARTASLLTVLANPPRSNGNAYEAAQILPFSPDVINTTVAEFDRLPLESQQWLVDGGWDRVRSSTMLPVVRKMALAGDGPALLHWLELDPPAATEFVRYEVVRPAPRFSSFYLRLPDDSLPGQEAQIAANFIALRETGELTRAASLVQRYATRAVLGTVLPFIDANRAKWPCSVRVPVLAYLLKVSPTDAEPRMEEALSEERKGTCGRSTLFTDIGVLEPGPVLERLALAEIDKGPTVFAANAATYLQKYGSVAVKPLLRERLARWHQTYVDRGTEKRWKGGASTVEDGALRVFVQALAESFGSAQAWLLSPRESSDLQALLGAPGGIGCLYNCASSLGIDGEPGIYAIYGRVNDQALRSNEMEYLNLTTRLHYTINQYRCDRMTDLKQKILQFPAGSTFDFAWDFTEADRNEVVEIGTFLRGRGYRVGNTHRWTFLQSDPPQ
jgi:sugar lactone lactonase YvrE